VRNKVAKDDILAGRRKADEDNYACAIIWRDNPGKHPHLDQWAPMILAKGKPLPKRGEQVPLLEQPIAPAVPNGPRRMATPIVSVKRD
jgi:hypothetical protein